MYKSKLGISFFLSLIILLSPANAEVNPESIIQIFQRLEILEKKSRELTGQNEVLKHQIEQLKKVQKQGFLNVDEQIDELRSSMKQNTQQQASTEQKTDTKVEKPAAVVATPTPVKEAPAKPAAPKQEPATPAKPTAAAPVTVKTDGVKTLPAKETDNSSASTAGKPRAPSDYEKETYQQAFNKMSSSPTAATRAFEDYIKLQPNSPLAANAQYWIGEIMYSHNNYKGAVKEFIKVLQKYKNSSKAPDAAIKLGYSFYALKNWTYARRTFEDVLKYFPDNKNAVNLATKRLEKMKAAGN